MNRPVRIGINGLGRIGRLALRAAWGNPAFTVTHLNEIAGNAAMMAHLLEFDSIHGKWNRQMMASDTHLTIDDHSMRFSAWNSPADGAWEVIQRAGRLIRPQGILTRQCQTIRQWRRPS